MNSLADFIVKMAENVDTDVCEWLRQNRPSEYVAPDLLANLPPVEQAQPAQIAEEEVKEEPAQTTASNLENADTAE